MRPQIMSDPTSGPRVSGGKPFNSKTLAVSLVVSGLYDGQFNQLKTRHFSQSVSPIIRRLYRQSLHNK
jgi:hypothetical protein